MDSIVVIVLIVAAVKVILIAILLLTVFRQDVRQMFERKKPPLVPPCMYCGSKWTRPTDEGQTKWEDEGLVLVTTYECQHCHLPFWHVERVPLGKVAKH